MMLLAQQVDAARAAGALVGFLCGLSVILVIGTLIGAGILIGSCKLFNTMVRKPASRNGVPMPEIGKAMGIIFATTLLNVVLAIVIGVAAGVGATAMGGGNRMTSVIVQLISNSLSFFLLTGMLTALLPAPIGRAALVALLYYAISIIIVVLILLVIAGSFGTLTAG